MVSRTPPSFLALTAIFSPAQQIAARDPVLLRNFLNIMSISNLHKKRVYLSHSHLLFFESVFSVGPTAFELLVRGVRRIFLAANVCGVESKGREKRDVASPVLVEDGEAGFYLGGLGRRTGLCI